MLFPELSATIGLAALLGVRHGMDADHLAAIDGLARLNVSAGRPRLASLSGLMFSAGHGCVLIGATLLFRAHPGNLPPWLESAGSVISILMLMLLGIVNLGQSMRQGSAGPVNLLAPRLLRAPFSRHPAGGLLVGALFAISFDSFAIAAWFGAASASAKLDGALLLAVAFVAGMVACDGATGACMGHLIRCSESFSSTARRLFSALVATTALAIASLGIVRMGVASVDTWSDQSGLWISAALMVSLCLGFCALRQKPR